VLSVQKHDDAMIAVLMTVDTAWNNLPVQNIYLGSFAEGLVGCFLFLAESEGWKISDDDVLLINGSCAWWVSS